MIQKLTERDNFCCMDALEADQPKGRFCAVILIKALVQTVYSVGKEPWPFKRHTRQFFEPCVPPNLILTMAMMILHAILEKGKEDTVNKFEGPQVQGERNIVSRPVVWN